jgi:Tfp pilus assembly protein PilO
MNNSTKNSLVLLGVLLLMSIAGFAYIHYRLDPQIEDLEATLRQRQQEYNTLQAKAATFDQVQRTFVEASYKFENYPKELFINSNVATVYDFLRTVNTGSSFTAMNFSFRDSVNTNRYGLMRYDVQGRGTYRNFYNFVSLLEQSRPINRINNLRLLPVNELGSLSEVEFSFTAESFYYRNPENVRATMATATDFDRLSHNPFFPLVHNVPPNENNLPDVERSRLVAVTAGSVYMIDQTGQMKNLRVGDEVYLGRLERIDFGNNAAVFLLNRGGIRDRVTLNLR